MARRPRPASTASVTWRDGVHLGGTPIWCDARRRRDVCFVSSAERIGRSGHGQLIGTPLTLALLAAEPGHLAVPLHQRFTLGTLRLELIASGRGPGAAALVVDHAGRKVLYAGSVRTEVAPNIESGEVRTCEAVVVAAADAGERSGPPLAEVVDRTIAWTRAALAADRRPVLLVDGALEGLEVAGCLHAAGIAVAGARPIREAARRAAGMWSQHASLAIGAPGREPRAIVWPEADRSGLARALGDRAVTLALVSDRAAPTAARDAAFAWPSAADRAQLLAWIEATGAREIYVTGPGAEAVVPVLGPRARVLGPPHQMTLFDEAVP